jgi:hypothetical protein
LGSEAPGLASHFDGLIAIVGLPGGSRIALGLSRRGLMDVAVRESSDDFTFIPGDHRYRSPSSLAPFLSRRVSELHSSDEKIGIDIEDPDELFGVVFEAARQCRSRFSAAMNLLWRLGRLSGIQGFMNSFAVNWATRLQWRTALIAFISFQALDATFQRN